MIKTSEQIALLIRYDSESGKLYWREWRSGRRADLALGGQGVPGKRSFLHLDGHYYAHHRLAWCLHHGEWPLEWIDHVNGEPSDNRISNLRDVTPTQNSQNRKTNSNNTTGHRGVTANHKNPAKPFTASITVAGKRHRRHFADGEEATRWYREKELELRGEFARDLPAQ